MSRLPQRLDVLDPLCPDWTFDPWLNRSFYKHSKYSSKGVYGGSGLGWDASRGVRFTESTSTSPTVVSRVAFENINQGDHDFTMGCFCVPESGSVLYSWVLAISGGVASPPIAIGFRPDTMRDLVSFEGVGVTWFGGNNTITSGDPYFISLAYDSVNDNTYYRWHNLKTGNVHTGSHTSSVDWPTTIGTSLSVGAYERNTSTYYYPTNGTISRAFYWNRTLSDDQLYHIATQKKTFLTDLFESVVVDEEPPEPPSVIIQPVQNLDHQFAAISAADLNGVLL